MLREQRGSSILEVLLSMAIIALIAPFLYNQITGAADEIHDIRTAQSILELREPALNFVRLNQDAWPEAAQIRLSAEELAKISADAASGFIDKYAIKGATITDIYLAFRLPETGLRVANIARNMGASAAVTGPDGVASGGSWAIAAPDLQPGDLVYRITYDFTGEDNSKFLHRATTGEDDFNVMQRALNMGKFDVFNIGTASAQSAKLTDAAAAFLESKDVTAASLYFQNGATMDGNYVKIGNMRVTGDITGFRNITAGQLNGKDFATQGVVIADRATVSSSVNVGNDMTLKSDTQNTISGFSGISAHYVATPFVYADQMLFNTNFGITVSGELLYSDTPPLKIGSWTFPSTNPPKFSRFSLARAPTPAAPGKEFDIIIQKGWKDVPAMQ